MQLTEGHWIEVKKRLTVGESRKVMGSMVAEIRADGRMTPNFEQAGKGEVLAYLVDWSLTDEAGKRVPIDTDAKKAAAIDNMSEEYFKILSQAIEAHVAAMDAERVAEKNDQGTLSAPAAT